MDSLRGTLHDRIENSLPRVPVTIRRSIGHRDPIWILELTCPFCHRLHQHGGGVISEPPALGHRVAHCTNRHSAGYELVSNGRESPREE